MAIVFYGKLGISADFLWYFPCCNAKLFDSPRRWRHIRWRGHYISETIEFRVVDMVMKTASPVGNAKMPDDSYIAVRNSNANQLMVRTCDIILSLSALLFLLPIFVVVAVLIKIQDGGPIFYAQTRIGRNAREFKCYKFRSMHVRSADILAHILTTDPEARAEWEADHKLKNDPRITPLGRFLRKTSLDELPQLWNVLRQDMSLVGPRPIVRDEISKYGRSFRNYTSVLPGITGAWQVSGRNDVDYRRRVALDRLFSRRVTFANYMSIIVRTVPAVLAQRGSY